MTKKKKTIQINNTTLEQEIDAIKGLHTLTVITVDEENNTDTKVQKINGVSKPKVSVTTDDSKSYFIIKASDDEKLSKLQFKINQDDNKEYFFNLDNFNMKEFEFTTNTSNVYLLQQGENIIEVTVTNSDGVTEETGVIRVTK